MPLDPARACLHLDPPLSSENLCLHPETGMAVPAITSSTHTQHSSTPAPEPCISLLCPHASRAHSTLTRHWKTPPLREYLVREVSPPHSGSSGFAEQNGDRPPEKARIRSQL